MSERGSRGPQGKVTLKEILKRSGQPISEEQAWALCYQCSSHFQQVALGGGQLPVLRGVDSISIHQDGAVSFTSLAGTLNSNQTEKKAIEQLGKVVYTALDWGLGSDIERVLSDSLDYLLFWMLGLNGDHPHSPTGKFPEMTHKELMKECGKRLFLPAEASSHYKAVCRTQYVVHMEICNLLQTIKQSKQNLMKLDNHDEKHDWGALWCSVIKEIRLGIRLCCAKQRSYNRRPYEPELTPHQRLMEDIRCRRYTLRQVKECDQNKSSISPEENIILDLIRSLKPASERKLRARPREEPSLHELLMSEIKSSKRLRSTADRKNDDSQSEEFSVPSGYPYYRRRLSKWSCIPTIDFQDSQVEERMRWNSEFSYDSSSERKYSDLNNSSSGDHELSFLPVWTSSQVDLRMSSVSSQRQQSSGGSSLYRMPLSFHKRSSSYEGSFLKCSQDEQTWDSPKIRLAPTISELAPVRRMMVKTEMAVYTSSRDFPGQKACSSCQKRLSCWRVACKFCERNICPDCRIEMLMPFQKCMNLPVSFFKALVLNQETDPDCLTRHKDLFQWDSSSIPLVLSHPRHMSSDVHKWIMCNWTSMPICLKCQEYILDIIDRSLQSVAVIGGLKSRSMSESSTPLLRH